MLSIFSYVCWPPVCPLWRNVYSHPLPWTFKLDFCVCVCVCVCVFYTFFIKFGSETCIRCSSNYVLPFHGLSFYFVDGFLFTVQKPFSLMQSHLFIFSFVFPAWGNTSDKIWLWAMSKILLPMFFSRIFMVLELTFKSLIYLNLFVCVA